VKLQGTCRACGRGFLVEQAIDAGGRCPWCAIAFQKDYAATLVDSLRVAQDAASALSGALERIREMDPALSLDEGALLDPLRDSLRGTSAATG
jgi:hypothetical protein